MIRDLKEQFGRSRIKFDLYLYLQEDSSLIHRDCRKALAKVGRYSLCSDYRYLTRYGLPQTAVAIVLLILGIAFFLGKGIWWGLVMVVVALAALAFFRDPERKIPADTNMLLSPADGKITDISTVTEDEFIHGPALRIGIFLSVFDVHLNRSCCPGEVAYIQAHPGKCINAMHADKASRHNRANCVGLNCPEHPAGIVMIKQITGAIARRIVCDCVIGDRLGPGQRFGMIKFGSRTELFFPVDNRAEIVVKKGDTVRAGTTIMVRYNVNV